MKNIETELISSEIGGWSYLRPVHRSGWKEFADACIGAALIVGFVAGILWLALHGI